MRVMPVPKEPKKLDEETIERLRTRRAVLDSFRKQTRMAENRLRFDIFNTWRNGGTMTAIAEASGYTMNWVSHLIDRIRNNDRLLQMAIDEYLKENPDATL